VSSKENDAMQIILHGGNARALAYEALEKAKAKDFAGANAKLKEADKELELAHEVQTELLQKEAQAANQTTTLLLAHALDHLMNANSEKGLIQEIIELYKKA